MPKQHKPDYDRTTRVLRFPETGTPRQKPPANDEDALADAIRKAWTQKSSSTPRDKTA